MFQKTLSILLGNVFMNGRLIYTVGLFCGFFCFGLVFFGEIWGNSVQRMRYAENFKVQLD